MNIKTNLRQSPTNSAFPTFRPQALTIKRAGASVVVKIWPSPRWRYVTFIFQLFEIHQRFPPQSMSYSTSSKSSLFHGSLSSEVFNCEPSSSSNKSLLISTDSYTVILSSMFITRNTTQYGQLWTVANFLACNPNKPAPLIAVVLQ